jgi:hypothetical protein
MSKMTTISIVITWLLAHQWVSISALALYEIIIGYFPTLKKSKSLVYWIIQLFRFLVPDLVNHKDITPTELKQTKIAKTMIGKQRIWV